MGIIVALLALWLICIVIGFVVKTVLWLAIVGVILFIATAGAGVIHTVTTRRR